MESGGEISIAEYQMKFSIELRLKLEFWNTGLEIRVYNVT